MLRQWQDKTDEFEVEVDNEDFKKMVQYAEDDFNRGEMMEDRVVWVVEDSKYTLFINFMVSPEYGPETCMNTAYL